MHPRHLPPPVPSHTFTDGRLPPLPFNSPHHQTVGIGSESHTHARGHSLPCASSRPLAASSLPCSVRLAQPGTDGHSHHQPPTSTLQEPRPVGVLELRLGRTRHARSVTPKPCARAQAARPRDRKHPNASLAPPCSRLAPHARHSRTRFVDRFVINCTVIHVIHHIAQLPPRPPASSRRSPSRSVQCPAQPQTGSSSHNCTVIHVILRVAQLHPRPPHPPAGLLPAPFHSLDPARHNRQPEVTRPRATTAARHTRSAGRGGNPRSRAGSRGHRHRRQQRRAATAPHVSFPT